jgi:hypothetical protein
MGPLGPFFYSLKKLETEESRAKQRIRSRP